MAVIFASLAISLSGPTLSLSPAAVIARVGTPSQHDKLLRVTAADVAAVSGVDLAAVRSQLADLAADIPGSAMEVTKSGLLVYAFPRDVAQVAARQADYRQPILLSKGQILAQACVGLLLIASVALLRPLIRSRGAQRVHLGGELRALQAAVLDQPPSATSDVPASANECLPLACFAFLLGDGGHVDFESERMERQFAAISTAIRASKGAVCADQLAPHLLTPPPLAAASVESTTTSWLQPVDEWMMPILARFDGRPVVSDGNGELVYTFPELLPTAKRDARYGLYPTHAPLVQGAGTLLKRLSGPRAESDYLREPFRTLTTFADEEGQRRVLGVAFANWGALIVLGALLGPLQLGLRATARGAGALTLLNTVYGALLLNGGAFLFLPAARRLRLMQTNLSVRRRNRLRKAHAAALLAAESPLASTPAERGLARRLQAARELRQRGRAHEAAAGEEALYTTAKSALEQADSNQPVRDEWDEKLRRRTATRRRERR